MLLSLLKIPLQILTEMQVASTALALPNLVDFEFGYKVSPELFQDFVKIKVRSPSVLLSNLPHIPLSTSLQKP